MINTVLLDLYGVLYPDQNNQATNFIAKIKDLGIRIIAVTNLSPDSARQICDQHSIITAYICQEIGLDKTDPQLYEKILEDNDLTTASMIMLDDTCANLAAAKMVGIKTVYFGQNACPGSDEVINSLSDFLLILNKK
ncbi:hypothetical protein COT97_03165 [Candidatus Falkowbacteria bacterium CG10_big_fil_rev_8_21_14_0_10_39_11]|uniref:HAD family hydrolase n=1 Tax=Candidatus Falkowbacteria bacterium CG10_big_fil_rev_8_21_14_0_10_39_11 TaxID=1974565 RepID=A0A2H0V4V4_9BACT|nr:MAG: hypothetical protein COT97_03165 [Candidatus Falkowbacteria bacterium CG10_big_fil_rev_8_21_14_0_10_39_11]